MDDYDVTYEEETDIANTTTATTTVKYNQSTVELTFKTSDFNSLVNISKIKEFLYQEAITNLIKKSKFLQLYIQLAENQINEDEYEDELTGNPDKYFINIKELNSGLDLSALLLILKGLPNNLSVDEVSEIFGIKSQSLLESLNQ